MNGSGAIMSWFGAVLHMVFSEIVQLENVNCVCSSYEMVLGDWDENLKHFLD